MLKSGIGNCSEVFKGKVSVGENLTGKLLLFPIEDESFGKAK